MENESQSPLQDLINQAQLVIKIAGNETKLAWTCIKGAIALTVLLLMIIGSLWLTLLALMGYGFFLLTQSVFFAVLLVFAANCFLYLLVYLFRKILISNLFFKSTRKQLSDLVVKNAD